MVRSNPDRTHIDESGVAGMTTQAIAKGNTTMSETVLATGWQDWLVVAGYLGFALFVIWGVFNGTSKPK